MIQKNDKYWKISYENKSDKSKSKSRSKSPDKKKEKTINPNFFFKQKSIFLTYPHTEKQNISKQELGDFLLDTFKPEVLVVCCEHHKDGGLHLHAWMEFNEVFYTRNYRLFDFKNNHPNIGRILNASKNTRANALNYMLKEDKELLYNSLILKS